MENVQDTYRIIQEKPNENLQAVLNMCPYISSWNAIEPEDSGYWIYIVNFDGPQKFIDLFVEQARALNITLNPVI